MPIVDELMDNVGQVISTASESEEVWFTKLDLNYAFSQLPLSDETSKHCNFSIVGGKATGTYRFLTGFYGLTDMPTEFQKAMDRTLLNLANTFCKKSRHIIVQYKSVSCQLKPPFIRHYISSMDTDIDYCRNATLTNLLPGKRNKY